MGGGSARPASRGNYGGGGGSDMPDNDFSPVDTPNDDDIPF